MTAFPHKTIMLALSLIGASSIALSPVAAQDYYPPSSNDNTGGRVYTEPGEYNYQKPRQPSTNYGQNRDQYTSSKPYNPYSPSKPAYAPPSQDQSNYGYYGIPDKAGNTNTRPSQNPDRYSNATANDKYNDGTSSGGQDRPYQNQGQNRVGQPYAPPQQNYVPDQTQRDQAPQAKAPYGQPNEVYNDQSYSENEITEAGHRFFGKITKGLAKVIARAFKKSGRPNGYILGEEGSGAFIAGLRYGEGKLYTKSLGKHPIFWQGPSIGYDFGASGSKTMTLVYNLKNIDFIYQKFGGVTGSAYVVGGIGITLMKRDNVTLAPIRSGIGIRLGANIGYLKFTRRPTWNPF